MFYNSDLGLFEEVSVPQKASTVESVPHVLSPSSSCSLILTDDNFIAVSYYLTSSLTSGATTFAQEIIVHRNQWRDLFVGFFLDQ